MRCVGVYRGREREALAKADLLVETLEDAAVAEFLG